MRIDPSLISAVELEAAVLAEAEHRRSLMPQSTVVPVLLDRPAEVANWARMRLSGDFDPIPEQIVTVRKSRHGVRPVAELYLRDQLLYRSLVNKWASQLPYPERSSEAFDSFEEAPLLAWSSYVVSSDIAAFYQYVDYDLLSRELVARTGDAIRVDSLIELLTAVTGRRFGIPQQNNPSDWLAECYIDVLERRLIRSGLTVWRYNDDFRIAANTWADALAAVDLLDREARNLGLTLNDSKTVIRKWDTYQTALSRRETVRQEIAAEVELDLSDINFGPYGVIDLEPDRDDVRTHAFIKILERWQEHADDDPTVLHALVQLIPVALAHLALSPETADEVADICMELLRTEQTLTPAVAQYLQRLDPPGQPHALAAFDRLLDTNPYLTPWQASWLAPALSTVQALAVGPNGPRRAEWLKSVWNDPRAPEPVRASIAQTLARHRVLSADDLFDTYDRMAETSRPALAAALGSARLPPSSPRAKALVAEDALIRWQFEWGASVP